MGGRTEERGREGGKVRRNMNGGREEKRVRKRTTPAHSSFVNNLAMTCLVLRRMIPRNTALSTEGRNIL